MTQNFDLLKSLYCIHSKSGNEKKMRMFIKRWIKQNVADAVVVQDKTGNLLVTRGKSETYPCICSHMDQVQDFHSKDFKAIETDDIIFGYSPKMREHQGLGADDKNGIWVALLCLQKYNVMKCAFFVGEEIGCVGSSACDVEWFHDCRYCLQIDRRGHSDLITEIGWKQICSYDFAVATSCNEYGYKVESGLMTDVEALRNRGVTCSCVNMSCGYYDPHTDHEYTVKADLLKCLTFVEHIIETCTDVYAYDGSMDDEYDSYNYGYRGRSRRRISDRDKKIQKSIEYDEASDTLMSAFEYGEVGDKESFEQWVADYSWWWSCLNDDDYKKMYEDCKKYFEEEALEFSDTIEKLA